MKNIFHIFIVLFLLIFSDAVAQTTYYVSAGGNDANNGTSAATSWKTPIRVRFTAYSPGDSILFKRGDTFYGELCDTLIGTSALPIVVGAYGSGEKPIIYGNCQDLTWTKSWANDSVYQMPIGIGTRTWVYPHQFVNGAWHQAWFDPPSVRGSDPGSWEAFLDGMADGVMAHSLNSDTLFFNPYGSINPAATGWDSLKVMRSSNYIFNGSANYIIRDLDVRYFNIGIEASGDSGLIRNVDARYNNGNGLRFGSGATDCVIDSCVIDSTSDTGMYFVQALRCILRYTTITNVGQPRLAVASDYGLPASGVDRTAIGILDHYADDETGYGYNLMHNLTMENTWTGFFDYYFCIGDTVRDNIGIGAKGAASPHGTDLVVVRNTLTMYPDSGGNGFTASITRAGNILMSDNVLTNIRDYGQKATSTDSVGTITFTRNYIDMRIISPRNFDQFVDTLTTTIVSTNNTFVGGYIGIQGAHTWRLNGVDYEPLSDFQQQTGYEFGSTWSLNGTRSRYLLFRKQ